MKDLFSEFTVLLPALMGLALFFRPYHPRTLVLGVLLILISFAHGFVYLVYTGLIYSFPHVFPLHLPVVISIGPVIYFYILFVIDEREKLYKKDMLHLILPALYFIFFIPIYILNGSYKASYLREIIEQREHFHIKYFSATALLVTALYIVLSGIKIARRALHSNQRFWKILAALIVFWLFTVFSAMIGVLSLNIDIIRYNSYLLGIIIIMLYILSQRYPYLMLFGTLPEKIQNNQSKNNSKNKRVSYLGSVPLDPLKRRLKILMDQEKFYRDENLSLKSLSQALEITPHQLSELLNTVYQKNFNQYINQYRTREACTLLLEDPQRNTLSIAYDVGFNSYSVFHSAFKNGTGMTPGEYRKRNFSRSV